MSVKLSSNCKAILDALHDAEPNTQNMFYTVTYAGVLAPDDMPWRSFIAAMDTLSELKCIRYVDEQRETFLITALGLDYRELERLDTIERWKERGWGFLAGFLLTAISGAVTVLAALLQ